MDYYYFITRFILLSAFCVSLYTGYTIIYLHACERPQTYTVGLIDPIHDISEQSLVEILQRIEYVWEEPMGRTLTFQYVDGPADITINLPYSNQDFASGQQYDKGDFYKGELNIYEFEDRYDLALVLAHELGHALGLEHVDDPNAIMHYLLPDAPRAYPELTTDDYRELKTNCRLI